MKIRFLKDFEAQTTSGTKLVPAETVLDLVEEKAARLIAAGVAVAVEDVGYNPAAVPFIDERGRLVVPFDCHPRYRYWAGGQGIKETLQELFSERVAIMQHDGDLTAEQADREAAAIMSTYIKEVIG